MTRTGSVTRARNAGCYPGRCAFGATAYAWRLGRCSVLGGLAILPMLQANMRAQAALAGVEATKALGSSALPDAPAVPAQAASPAQPSPAPRRAVSGTMSGTVLDSNGGVVAGATLTLASAASVQERTAVSDATGYFSFPSVDPGTYDLSIRAAGFAPWTETGIPMQLGVDLDLPEIMLKVASATADVVVTFSPHELAAEQVRIEEKQRVLGVFPNFYTSYVWKAEPLTTKQKFQLAWRSSIDWEAFAASAAIAGVQQADDSFEGYGQGVEGYAKRFGASYTDGFAGTMIGGAVLPTLFRQDPRYFYKGVGTIRQRALYAIATTVICRGDNGRWQPNYSNLGGNLAAGALSNLYYPKGERSGISTTIENALIGTAAGAAGALIQEFLLKKITPGAAHDRP